MKLLKKIPKAVIIVAAVLVVAYIIVTLVGHFGAVSRIGNKREQIQQRQETVFRHDED